MRARIKVWGKSYLIELMDWGDSGAITSVSFTDEDMIFHTVFNNEFINIDNVEGDRYSEDLLHADLNKVISWEDN